MLILGGAATVTALSGVNVYAASFLIPLSAVPFTMHGPLRRGRRALSAPAAAVLPSPRCCCAGAPSPCTPPTPSTTPSSSAVL